MIDPAITGVLLEERLARASLHRPVNRLRKQVQPMPMMPAWARKAKVRGVGLFARNEQELAIREPLAFFKHGFHFGEAERSGVLRVAITVEFRKMHHLHTHLLEHA